MAEIGKRKGEEIVVADLTPLTRIDELKKVALQAAAERAEEGAAPDKEPAHHAAGEKGPGIGVDSATEVEGAEEKPELNTEDEAPPSEDEVIARAVGVKPLVEGVRTAGVVTQVDDGGKRAIVDLVSRSAQI